MDPDGIFREGTLGLSDVGIADITIKGKQLRSLDIEESQRQLIETKILEITNHNGYTISQEKPNKKLFDLLKNPKAFYEAKIVPTALDIAEALTRCRLQLENLQDLFVKRAEDVRLKAVYMLNSISLPLFALYEKLNALLNKSSDFDAFIKHDIVSHLIDFCQDEKDYSITDLESKLAIFDEGDAHSLRQIIDDIIIGIRDASASWKIKDMPVVLDELSPQQQQRNIKMTIDDTLRAQNPDLRKEDLTMFASASESISPTPLALLKQIASLRGMAASNYRVLTQLLMEFVNEQDWKSLDLKEKIAAWLVIANFVKSDIPKVESLAKTLCIGPYSDGFTEFVSFINNPSETNALDVGSQLIKEATHKHWAPLLRFIENKAPEAFKQITELHQAQKAECERLKQAFDKYFPQLQKKQARLAKNTSAEYTKVNQIAGTLIVNLKAARATLDGENAASKLPEFNTACQDALKLAKPVFQDHRSKWHRTNNAYFRFFKAFLGMLAAITVLPALISMTKPSGFKGVFFSKPQTASEQILDKFENHLFPKDNKGG